nr:MAG TPA: hypothetical protein [Caudoviricetes sp.]
MRRSLHWSRSRISREKTTQPQGYRSGAYFYIDKCPM